MKAKIIFDHVAEKSKVKFIHLTKIIDYIIHLFIYFDKPFILKEIFNIENSIRDAGTP